MFYCAISGELPQEPVVSAKSGKVYERRLIAKYIAENGTDPVTGEKLEDSDLIAIKACKNVFNSSATLE
jgi:pre-mRNA-processing factor 19